MHKVCEPYVRARLGTDAHFHDPKTLVLNRHPKTLTLDSNPQLRNLEPWILGACDAHPHTCINMTHVAQPWPLQPEP